MIDVQTLSFTYGEEAVLNEINLTIEKGSFTAVLGRNGSGKSTLAKQFNALLLPSGGRVFVKGMDTADKKLLFEIRKTAGMIFQNPDNQMVAAMVEDEVAFAPENLGIEPSEIRRRVRDCLEAVSMTEYAEKQPSQLSGGQKQRVAIAAVLAMEPEILILDEATAMLDPAGRKEVLRTVKKLNKEQGITVVWITHFMEEAVKADRVIVMDNGTVALDGAPREVFKSADKIKALGLDVPQITELMLRLKRGGLNVRCDALTAEEGLAEITKVLGGAAHD